MQTCTLACITPAPGLLTGHDDRVVGRVRRRLSLLARLGQPRLDGEDHGQPAWPSACSVGVAIGDGLVSYHPTILVRHGRGPRSAAGCVHAGLGGTPHLFRVKIWTGVSRSLRATSTNAHRSHGQRGCERAGHVGLPARPRLGRLGKGHDCNAR